MICASAAPVRGDRTVMCEREAVSNGLCATHEVARWTREHPDKARAMVRRSKAKKLAALVANPQDESHGKNSAYACGCRCELCRMAHTEYARELYWRKRYAS